MSDNTQHAMWNGPAGQAWVQAQQLLDEMFAPFAARLRDALPARAAQTVLDVGCGTGAVSLALAERLGADGHCIGVDISEAMIDSARQRARARCQLVDFIVADAQRHAFAAASVDRIVSRFGVMFFDDPVQAFTGLRRATRSGGALHVLAWRSAADNPFMTTAERAAAPLLALPARAAGAPGQFAFADRRHVAGLLADAGWRDVQIVAIDVICEIAAADLPRYVALLGPVGSALRERGVDPALRAQVLETVEAAFAPLMDGGRVRFTAACWEVHAVAP